MNIPLTTPIGAVLETFVRRKLEVEEADLEDYTRPLWVAPKRPKTKWTPTAARAFATEIVKGILP